MREHLRACAPCRAAMRDYKAAPEAAAALAPGLPLGHSLLDRLRDAFGDLWSRLPGTSTGAEGGAQVAVSGAGGSGAAGLTKAIAICVCAAGGGAAGVAAGVVPAPQALVSGAAAPQVIGDVEPAAATAGGRRGGTEAVRPHKRAREPRRPRTADGDRDLRSRDAEATPPIESTSPVAVPAPAPPPEPASEPVAEPAPEPAPVSSPESVSSGGAAGEFGP